MASEKDWPWRTWMRKSKCTLTTQRDSRQRYIVAFCLLIYSVFWLVFVNSIHMRVTRGENLSWGTASIKLTCANVLWRRFHDWLVWKIPVQCGRYPSWAGSPGLYKKDHWGSHGEQAGKQRFLVISASVSAPRFLSLVSHNFGSTNSQARQYRHSLSYIRPVYCHSTETKRIQTFTYWFRQGLL